MKNLTFGILFLATFLLAPTPVHAQGASWRVAFDDEGSEFRKALLGTLELSDGMLRFSADNRSVAWAIDLADVRAIARSEGYGEDSNAVVIESLAGERLYVAVLDKHLLYGSPKKALKAVDAALNAPTMRAARAANAAAYSGRRANADRADGPKSDDPDPDGKVGGPTLRR